MHVQRMTGRLAEAEASGKCSLELYEAYLRERPEELVSQARLAAVHHHLGYVRRMARRPAEAEASYRRALAIYERLTQEEPSVGQYRRSLGERTGPGRSGARELVRRRCRTKPGN
jgi:hypothetical protein